MKLLGCRNLSLAILVQSILAFLALPANAQIVNQATVSFTGGVISESTSVPLTVTSNEATVNSAGSSTTANSLQLVKTADRAAAEPGDTVIYRLSLRNTGTNAVSNLTISDTLPIGLQFITRSLQGSLFDGGSNSEVNLVDTAVSNRNVSFQFPGTLPAGGILTIVYAATVTPDALRGRGRNLAIVATDTGLTSNTASHLLRIRPGILSDCGTLIGRVFVDKNFDGEQQSGEPGVPNAVIFMDDGNRITTDADGLFSLAHVLPGYRTGTLDLTSLPGYTLAPNLRRIDKNSASRLVQIAPGSLRRMNFAVTPAFGEDQR